jgi:hypothetical protein
LQINAASRISNTSRIPNAKDRQACAHHFVLKELLDLDDVRVRAIPLLAMIIAFRGAHLYKVIQTDLQVHVTSGWLFLSLRS